MTDRREGQRRQSRLGVNDLLQQKWIAVIFTCLGNLTFRFAKLLSNYQSLTLINSGPTNRYLIFEDVKTTSILAFTPYFSLCSALYLSEETDKIYKKIGCFVRLPV